MYSDITNTFLNSIRALRLYVSSVEKNMENYRADYMNMDKPIQENLFIAQILHILIQLKRNGTDLNEIEMPDEINDIFKELIDNASKLIQEKTIDGKTIYQYGYLPKDVSEEYRKLEGEEKQKDILYSGSLMLLITYFENLISGVMKKDFARYPWRVALDEKSVSYKLLTEVQDVEEIKSILIDQEVTKKMYGSFLDWKRFFQKQLKLELKCWEDNLATIQEIMARRNIFVHNNGVINSVYVGMIENCEKSRIGENISIDREYIDQAINIIEYAGLALIIEIWIKEYSDDKKEIDNVGDLIFQEYLRTERWELAKHFYELCLNNNKLCDADKMMYQINRWQCYKWLGEYDKIQDELRKVDLSAYKPMFTLGILALKEDYEKFFDVFDKQTDIGEHELKEWPLFISIRESEEYKKRFLDFTCIEDQRKDK